LSQCAAPATGGPRWLGWRTIMNALVRVPADRDHRFQAIVITHSKSS
jgi:hypothetical protein